ncbi:hypothetical protein ABZ729_31375 [Streptomyces sp. NPDC006678]
MTGGRDRRGHDRAGIWVYQARSRRRMLPAIALQAGGVGLYAGA